jgi:uncharacterized protein (TIGR02246 family)
MRAVLPLAILLSASPALAQTHKTHSSKPKSAAGALAPAKHSESEDQQQIEDMHQRDIQATLTHDISERLALMTEDVVVLAPHHAPMRGHAQVKAYLEQAKEDSAALEPVSYNQQWQEVRIAGDYAYEWGWIDSRVRDATGKETSSHENIMRVLHREADGEWRIARMIWNEGEPQK